MDVADRLRAVRERIGRACLDAGRDPSQVRLLAVSKGQSAEAVRQAYEAGQRDFGENRVQELVAKAARLTDLDGLRWSMIGHLQTNKAQAVATVADEVQSLDSRHLAAALHRRLAAAGRTLPVLVQVNTSGEASKSGLAPHEVEGFARDLAGWPTLRPVGLMTVAVRSDDADAVAACFRTLAELRGRVAQVTGHRWPELSMGMSGDLEAAVAAGATCVRVGTAVFGSRAPQAEPPRS